jgi:hypothetical protein
MHLIREKEYPGEPGKEMLPCEWFDLIAGSDTGGYVETPQAVNGILLSQCTRYNVL